MFWKKKAPALSREDSLDAVVVRNEGLRVERNAEGVVTLFAPFQSSGLVNWVSRRMNVKPADARIELDEIGSFVWDMCDGQTTVREMIDRLAKKYKMNRKEAEVSLTTFIRSLAQRRLAGVAILKANES